MYATDFISDPNFMSIELLAKLWVSQFLQQ